MRKHIRRASGIGRAVAAIVLAAVMFAGAAVSAESQWDLFSGIPEMTGEGTPSNADLVMQRDLCSETVNNVEIAVREAGYDGRSLFLQYSYRILDEADSFAVTAADIYGSSLPQGMSGDTVMNAIADKAYEALSGHGVGWWIDHIWINGKAVDMPDGSIQNRRGSTVPGEIIQTEVWRLDKAGITLSGPVQVSLPIGEQQDLAGYTRAEHPEKYGEDGSLKLPEKGIVTFTYDAKDIRSLVKSFGPQQQTMLSFGTAKVNECACTPLMTYIRMELKTTAGGDGWEDWLCSLKLADGSGRVLFEGENYGLDAYTAEEAEFLYPCIDTIPDALYLAPADDNNKTDMSRAVPVYKAETATTTAEPTAAPTAVLTAAPTAAPTATATVDAGSLIDEDGTIHYGASDREVRKIQKRLNDLGYPAGYADGIYGQQTQEALNLFCDAIGVSRHKYISPSLKKKLFADSAPSYDPYLPLAKGDHGAAVMNMQRRLKELGYDPGKLDGKYGSQTVAAVAAFQVDYGFAPGPGEKPGEKASRQMLEQMFLPPAAVHTLPPESEPAVHTPAPQ